MDIFEDVLVTFLNSDIRMTIFHTFKDLFTILEKKKKRLFTIFLEL